MIALAFFVGFSLLDAGYPRFRIAFPVGSEGCIPIAIGRVRLHESRTGGPAEPGIEAVETLGTRYVRNELDEAEFEERLALLLETGSVLEATPHASRREAGREQLVAG